VKFTDTGKARLRITVWCWLVQPGGWSLISDRGYRIGTTSQTLNRLFTPFMQGESASSRRYGGTGLGAATARRLVQLMHGSMGIESQPVQGTTFWFLVPVEAAAAAAAPAPLAPVTNAASGRGRLLIVDDNPLNQLWRNARSIALDRGLRWFRAAQRPGLDPGSCANRLRSMRSLWTDRCPIWTAIKPARPFAIGKRQAPGARHRR
jgi:hypothetical protein